MKGGSYSTGEAAEILGISQSSVRRFYEDGKLKGAHIPGSRYRRMTANQLEDFLRAEGSLSNPFYVEVMRNTWEQHGFYPSIQQAEQTSQPVESIS